MITVSSRLSSAVPSRAVRHVSATTSTAKSATARVHTLPSSQLQHVVLSYRQQHYFGSRFGVLSSSFVSANGRRLLSSSSSASGSSIKGASPTIAIRWWHPVLGGLLITTAGGISYFYNFVGGSTEGLWRSLSFYSYAIPKVRSANSSSILRCATIYGWNVWL
jgi:hypothetical protein